MTHARHTQQARPGTTAEIENERIAALADLRATFGSEAGQRTLERLKSKVGYPRPSYIPGDPFGTHFNDGRKSVIAEIIHDLSQPEDLPANPPKALT